ncbi:hypothetical protein SCALM49S_03236 [Streptomyces californicus]
MSGTAQGAVKRAPDDLQTAYQDVINDVLPSVVQIDASEGLGSGVVYDDRGHIVTNAHVVGDEKKFKVSVATGEAVLSASPVSSYPEQDLAVIKLDDAPDRLAGESATRRRSRSGRSCWRGPAAGPVQSATLSLWLTDAMDRVRAWEDERWHDGGGEAALRERVAELVAAVRGTRRPVVLVTNEVGSGVVPATSAGRRFRDELGRLNAAVAAECEQVLLVVAGQVLVLRG